MTTREINNSIRPPVLFHEVTAPPDIQYLQSKHWKVPPNDAIRIVSDHFSDFFPAHQVVQIVLDKILVKIITLYKFFQFFFYTL